LILIFLWIAWNSIPARKKTGAEGFGAGQVAAWLD
jgi:hypothetical protein